MKGEILYRLVVTYPEGSLDEWGYPKEDWAPEGWTGFPQGHALRDGDDSFIWPANKLYWSKSGAEGRADLFRKYGAAVIVEKSDPITFGAPKAWGLPAEPPVGALLGRREGEQVVFYRRVVLGSHDGYAAGIGTPPAADALPLLEWWQVLKFGPVQLVVGEER